MNKTWMLYFLFVIKVQQLFAQVGSYNNTVCVTYNNLIYYNYTNTFDNYDSTMVFPENYCYGVLTYNITTTSLENIIDLNLQAFHKYRRFLNLFYYNSLLTYVNMESTCLHQFRRVACFSTFSSCKEDQVTHAMSVMPVCESECNDLLIKCKDFFPFANVCDNNSTDAYCAGIDSVEHISYSILVLFLILLVYSF